MRTNGYYPKRPQADPPDVAEQAVSLYLAGSLVKAVAGELGLKVQHVRRLVEERTLSVGSSVKRRVQRLGSARGAPPPGEWPRQLAAEVLERYVAGEFGVRIVESLGLAQSSVYGVLEACVVLRSHAEATCVREAGGQRPAGKVQAGLPAEQAVTQYLAGDPPRIIGRALGVSPTRVYLTLRERGVVRTRSEARMLAAGVRQLPEGWEAVVVERYVAGDSGLGDRCRARGAGATSVRSAA